MLLGNSKKKTLLSPEWPDAGHEAAEATRAGQSPRAPCPQPSPRLFCPCTTKEGELSRTTFYSSELFCFQVAWDQSHVALLQSLHMGAGPAGLLGTMRGLRERLQSFSSAVQCHCGDPVPSPSSPVLAPLHLPPPDLIHYPWRVIAELCRESSDEHLGP